MNKKASYTVGTICLLLFIALSVLIKSHYTHGPVPLIDPIFQALGAHAQSNHLLVSIAGLIAKVLGDIGGVALGLILCALLYFVFKQKNSAIWLAIVAVISVGGNTLIKHFIGRVRPMTYRLPDYLHESGKSFASGHSTFATILFGCLFFIIIQKISNSNLRFLLGLLALALILLAMFSRLVLGVHYPTDTLGGFLLGSTVIAFSYPTFVKKNQPFKRRRRRLPQSMRDEQI